MLGNNSSAPEIRRASPTHAGVKRRTVIKGAAWSIPVLAATAAAPAFAASVHNCPDNPAGGGINPISSGAWTWVKSANTNGAPAGMLNSTSNTFNMWVDSTSPVGTNTATVTATANISVTAGCQYPLTLTIQTQGGYFGVGSPVTTGCTTRNTNLQVSVGGANIFPLLSTQAVGGGTVVPFPVETPNANGGCPSNFGFGSPVVIPATYVATTTGLVQIKMQFTMWGNNNAGNNDDIHATLAFAGPCLC